MPLSYVEYSVATANDTYTIDFKFLDSSHVKLSVTSESVLVDHTNFTINSDGTLMTVGGTYGMPIKIYRQTPGTTSATKDDQVIDFQDGSVVSESDLDRASLQALYASQESKDYVDDSVAASTGTGELPTTTSENYILSSGTGVTPTPTWISSATLQPLLPAAVANDVNTIPIRSSDATPTITSAFVGDLTGDVTGDVSGSAGTLSPGKTIEITGDVEYTSPVFTGGANITAAAEVAKIRGKSVSEDSPAEGETLRYRDSVWTPETYIPGWAGFAETQTDGTEGKTTTAGASMDTVPLNTTLANGSISGMTLDDATDVITVPAGTYIVRWQVPCYSSTTTISYLKQSNSSSVDGSGFLSDSEIEGTGNCVRTGGSSGNSDQSHGEVRVVAATTVYWQLQLFTESAGTIGKSDASGGRSFYYSTIFAIKEPS